jgi:hypothetical protein
MAKNKDNKAVSGVTPIGIAVYPKLNVPDTKFNDKGVYSTKLRLTEEDAAPLIEMIDAMIEAAFDEALNNASTPLAKKKIKKADPPYHAEEDDQGNATGYILFNFKKVASGVTKDGREWKFVCPVYDAKLKPVDLTKVNIGGGSLIKVAFMATPFDVPATGVGVTLRLEAVQVLEAKSFGQKDASEYGFCAEEDYDGIEAQVDAEAAQFADDVEGDESGDF